MARDKGKGRADEGLFLGDSSAEKDKEEEKEKTKGKGKEKGKQPEEEVKPPKLVTLYGPDGATRENVVLDRLVSLFIYFLGKWSFLTNPIGL